MNNKLQFNFADLIANERKIRNLSLTEMADEIGRDDKGKHYMSPSYLSRLENNKSDSPGFKNVALLISKLSLSIGDVFRSFGYGHLLENAEEIPSFEDVLRKSHIEAPLEKKEGMTIKKDFLNSIEKEILISLINNLFNFGASSDDESIDYLIDLINDAKKYKKARKLKATDRKDSFRLVDIPYLHYSIKCTYEFSTQMDFYNISQRELFDLFSSKYENINYLKGGNYNVVLREKNLSLNFNIKKRELTLLSISSFID